MKKKIAMVILATCLFGTLAGCEKDSSNKPEVPSTENSTNSVNQTENSTEKSEGISALSNANLVGTVMILQKQDAHSEKEVLQKIL